MDTVGKCLGMIKPFLFHGSTVVLGFSILAYFTYKFFFYNVTDVFSIIICIFSTAAIAMTLRDVFIVGPYESLPSNEKVIWGTPLLVLIVIVTGYYSVFQ